MSTIIRERNGYTMRKSKSKIVLTVAPLFLTSIFLSNSTQAATTKSLTIWAEQPFVASIKSLSANWSKEKGITVEVIGKNGFGITDNLASLERLGKAQT